MLKKKVILYGLLLNVNNNYMMESNSKNTPTIETLFAQHFHFLSEIKSLQQEVAQREGRIIVKYNELLTLYKFYEKDFHDTSLPQTLETTFSYVEKTLLPKVDVLLLKNINCSWHFEHFALELKNFIKECDKTIACDLHGPLVALNKWHEISTILTEFTNLANQSENINAKKKIGKHVDNVIKYQKKLKEYILNLNFQTMLDNKETTRINNVLKSFVRAFKFKQETA